MNKQEINKTIDGTIEILQTIRGWVNDPIQDKKTKDNIIYWFSKLLSSMINLSGYLH